MVQTESDVSVEHTASIFRVKDELDACFCFVYYTTLKTEMICASGTCGPLRTTQRYISERQTLRIRVICDVILCSFKGICCLSLHSKRSQTVSDNHMMQQT